MSVDRLLCREYHWYVMQIRLLDVCDAYLPRNTRGACTSSQSIKIVTNGPKETAAVDPTYLHSTQGIHDNQNTLGSATKAGLILRDRSAVFATNNATTGEDSNAVDMRTSSSTGELCRFREAH